MENKPSCGLPVCGEHGIMEAKVKTLEKQRDKLLAEKDAAHKALWEEMRKKTNNSTFQWVIGMFFVVTMGSLAFQWSTYTATIQTKTATAEIKAKLEERSNLDNRIFDHLMEFGKGK